MLSREPQCDFTLFYDNKKSKLSDEECSKISKDAKQCTLQSVLKLAPLQNMLRPSLFLEDIYPLVKSCSCFFEISYYSWYLILCREFLLSKLCPGSVCLEHNLDPSYFAPPHSSLFFRKIFGT